MSEIPKHEQDAAVADAMRQASKRWKEAAYPLPALPPIGLPPMHVRIPEKPPAEPRKGLKHDPSGKPLGKKKT